MDTLGKRLTDSPPQAVETGMDPPPDSHQAERLEALSALIRISTPIGFMPMEPNASLQFLVKESQKLFGTYGCAICALDGDASFDLQYTGPPEMREGLLKHIGAHQACMVVRDELPFIAGDTCQRDTRCDGYHFSPEVKSYACLPISTGKRLIGILTICSLVPHAFAPYQLELLLWVATIAAAVIQRAQLFGKLDEEKKRLKLANVEINKLNQDLNAKIADLKAAQQQVTRTEKLAVVGRLAAGVAHEINNPTGIIINRIECLQAEAAEKGLPDDLVADLTTIGQYARRISLIVKDLSVLSRTTYSESIFSRIDINDLMADVLFLVSQKLDRRKVSLQQELASQSLFIMGDSQRLEQVFNNLITNAVQAIKDRGTISVAVRGDTRNDSGVQIDITDTGVGIPDDLLDTIWDPFFTTKMVGEGTGLGLTISHAIIKDHNGSIRVQSRVGHGSTFTITLPWADSPLPPQE